MSTEKMLPKAIICDLDGTCNIYQHYIQSKRKNWKAFYKALGDVVHEFCRDIVMMYKQRGDTIVLVTGRPEEYKPPTEEWLSAHGVEYDLLLMRKTGDSRKDFIVKQELYEQYIKSKYDILFVLEDRAQVVKMWREQGLTCLQVAERQFLRLSRLYDLLGFDHTHLVNFA
ncbi:LNS2 domain-containing protein [Gloeocapsopsis dulcis]|uniref:Polynucleotide kinase PNKP phosphatase domain-containing protein n=1 Tax=Gloeocapsopsis dulcis AAB1 = 1H9 TaxID=1433147 RepID=A0A6N8FUI6_9CHRO|nr:HAD family acid phosphatase [Gloeocapsopsis dulcis]MUL35975.1 hypothetical protein [Gloeocapsopsis dulcis AAB1 = 1H9]WNN88228.1 HAD family acid phosphatase [Gloeocapsopsis dulcis]